MTDPMRTAPCLRILGKEYTLERIAFSSIRCEIFKVLGLCRPDAICNQKGVTIHRPNDYTRLVMRQQAFGAITEVVVLP